MRKLATIPNLGFIDHSPKYLKHSPKSPLFSSATLPNLPNTLRNLHYRVHRPVSQIYILGFKICILADFPHQIGRILVPQGLYYGLEVDFMEHLFYCGTRDTTSNPKSEVVSVAPSFEQSTWLKFIYGKYRFCLIIGCWAKCGLGLLARVFVSKPVPFGCCPSHVIVSVFVYCTCLFVYLCLLHLRFGSRQEKCVPVHKSL